MKLSLPRNKDLRGDAAWVIYQILEAGKSSRECLNIAQRRHTSKDSAWIQEMTMGVMRQLPQLQLWLRALLEQPLKGKNKIIEHLLLLGLYQLAFSRVSEHAAVSETVNACPQLGSPGLKALVNAILRRFQRENLAHQLSSDPIVASGLPKWIVKALQPHYSQEQISHIIEQTNTIAPVWLRVNQQQTTVDNFTQSLKAHNVEYRLSDDHPDAVLLLSRTDIPSLPGYIQGWFSVQDGAAQYAARYLNPQPGERILDCCAAPGGKTSHILELAPNLNACVALDNEASRLARLKENIQRLKLEATVVHADAIDTDTWWDGNLFDRILLDAPCSATGVIRRHPDIRWLRKATDIERLVSLQQTMLDKLWPLLKEGGTLLYATCSILPQENAQQISRFLARYDDAHLDAITRDETDNHPGRQILPGEQQMDGFYYARLVKSAS
ncbi:16S rRNA (cytosine(967)-C(5))-methyltransferase RsmB [Alteromonas sp. ASW11-130]|uniref:16S rRNA (cytosine(967)-C(5))-methyltransferase RsmB n=1 Tax=Alteromonas sp. ASW11-130 TaxID=3015775 RepID=UPI002241D913|nr:16S rRNA (cytosine(967)-C(5))-methyltransferase RsmB [Alteromonas sp. ASW11-130]MCW8093468.1 16S rRNA (cytosine(967)-C(5))-methyltransferase RsmB [Alteromonas sp. ASW11-130]